MLGVVTTIAGLSIPPITVKIYRPPTSDVNLTCATGAKTLTLRNNLNGTIQYLFVPSSAGSVITTQSSTVIVRSGRIEDYAHYDFFPYGAGFKQLINATVDRPSDWPAALVNIAGCPVTYSLKPETCAGSRAPKPFPKPTVGSRTPIILDTDIGVFMDDPFAVLFAAMAPSLDLKMVITTSLDTTSAAQIVAKLLYSVGQKSCAAPSAGPVIAAGGSTDPTGPGSEKLLGQWALTPPDGWTDTDSAWLTCLAALVALPNAQHDPAGDPGLVESVKAVIAHEDGTTYWSIGPSQSLSVVVPGLDPSEISGVRLISMVGSIVPGVQLPFGNQSGFSPWAETNAKGSDAAPGGAGKDAAAWNMIVHSRWKSVLLSPTEPVIHLRFRGPAYATFLNGSSPAGSVMKALQEEWVKSSKEQCGNGETAEKCAPYMEALQLEENGYMPSPGQADVTSIMPWMSTDDFLVEAKSTRFEDASKNEWGDVVRGCQLQCTPDEECGDTCVSIATSFKAPDGSPETAFDVSNAEAEEGMLNVMNDILDVLSSGLPPDSFCSPEDDQCASPASCKCTRRRRDLMFASSPVKTCTCQA